MTKLASKITKKTQARGKAGQAIIEGTCMLYVFVIAAVGLILFVLDLGMAVVYKQKLAYLAVQGATYYTTNSTGWNYEVSPGTRIVDVQGFVKRLAGIMGIPSDNLTVTTGARGTIQTVTVTGSRLPLVSGVNFLPSFISLTETAAADPAVYPRPSGIIGINVSNDGNSTPQCYIPCYSGFKNIGNPRIPQTDGTYDQFTLSIPPQTGANVFYTRGTRGRKP